MGPRIRGDAMNTQHRSWWQKRRKLLIAGTVIALLVGVLLFILIGYQFHWNWTGFETKTLWDWLNLLGVLAIPVVAGLGVAWFTHVQQRRDQQVAISVLS
jgi:membrane protein DedA with SNARE-associated domain